MVPSKCVVPLRPIPSEQHYCTDTVRIPCDRQPTMTLSETATSENFLYCCLAVPYRASAMSVLCHSAHPSLLYSIGNSVLQTIFFYTRASSCPLWHIECGRQVCYVQYASVPCGKDKAHLSCRQECPICPLRNCLFLSDISFHLPRNYTATPHALAKRYKVCRHTDTFG